MIFAVLSFACLFVMPWGVFSESENTTVVPEYILPCYRKDPKVDECLKKSFNHLRPYLVSGLTDIQVPSIDPLRINKITIDNGNGPFKVKCVFANLTVKGASNYTIQKASADLDRFILDLGFTVPHMEIRGKYEIGGTVLLFPIRSKGDFWAVFVEVDAKARLFGKEVKDKNGTRFMRIDKMHVDFDISKSRFKVRDVINLGNIIGQAINQFMNNNSDEIISEMKPAASVAIAKHFKAFLNSAFLKIPLKLWLPDV